VLQLDSLHTPLIHSPSIATLPPSLRDEVRQPCIHDALIPVPHVVASPRIATDLTHAVEHAIQQNLLGALSQTSKGRSRDNNALTNNSVGILTSCIRGRRGWQSSSCQRLEGSHTSRQALRIGTTASPAIMCPFPQTCAVQLKAPVIPVSSDSPLEAGTRQPKAGRHCQMLKTNIEIASSSMSRLSEARGRLAAPAGRSRRRSG